MRQILEIVGLRMLLALSSIGIFMLRRAVGRHDVVSRWLDYLPQRRAWSVIHASGLVLSVVTLHWGVSILFLALLMFRRSTVPPSSYLVAVWESMVWLGLAVVTLSVASFTMGSSETSPLAMQSIGSVSYSLVSTLLSAFLSYLLVDLARPNRPRRRRRALVVARRPLAEWAT